MSGIVQYFPNAFKTLELIFVKKWGFQDEKKNFFKISLSFAHISPNLKIFHGNSHKLTNLTVYWRKCTTFIVLMWVSEVYIHAINFTFPHRIRVSVKGRHWNLERLMSVMVQYDPSTNILSKWENEAYTGTWML